MHLRPENPKPRQTVLDIGAASVLILLLVYTKMTYGVVALAFLFLTLLQPAQRLWAGGALAASAAAALSVEFFWGGTRGYIADLMRATNVSGVTPVTDDLRSLLTTSEEYAVFLSLAALAIWQRPGVSDFLFYGFYGFYGFCACAGFVLLNQNF
jgi:hypothetical protein